MKDLKLRPYQQEDVEKLQHFSRCGILNEPRTGKTPTSLILCSKWPGKKTLIVCTGSMLYKWKEEYENWLHLPCLVFTGTPKQREKILKSWTDGLVITYDTLKMIKHYEKQTEEQKQTKAKKVFTHSTGAILDIIKCKPSKLIVDEFHRAKGRNSARIEALYALAKVIPFRVVLTGTPAYSTQLDVFTMLKFLWPEQSAFKSWWTFNQYYVEHETLWLMQNGKLVSKQIPTKLNKAGIKLVHQIFNKYCTQRKTNDSDVMPWLPKEPIPELIKLPCSKEQEKAVQELEKWFETENEEVVAKNGLDKITKIRQLLSEPKILMPEIKNYSPKTKFVLDFMTEYPESPTIFYTNSTKHIKILLPLMNNIAKTECIIGATPMKDRNRIEKDFQTGKVTFLICNTQAVQEGLTLDRAEYEIFIEQFPPYGSVYQASKRFTPTNPETAKIPKKILKLIMKKTYDEIINETIDNREENVNVLNNFRQYLKGVKNE